MIKEKEVPRYIVFNTTAVAKTQAVHQFDELHEAFDYEMQLNDKYPDKNYVTAEVLNKRSWFVRLMYWLFERSR